MKRILFLWLLTWLLAPGRLSAQEIEIGMQAPDIRPKTWVGGVQPSADYTATCILFITLSNGTSVHAIERIQELAAYSDRRMRVVIVAREEEQRLQPIAGYCAANRMAVAEDTDGRIFRSFGVEYAPYALVTDRRNRVVWQGNPSRLTTDVIDAETTQIF